MKAVPAHPNHQQPGVFTLEMSLTLVGVTLLVTFIWLLKGTAPIAPGTYRPPVLDVVLMGTLTSRFETDDVQIISGSKGLSLIVHGELPFLLVLEGVQSTSVYDPGDKANALSLHLLEGDRPYHSFSTLEGSIALEDGGVRFSARLEDEEGDPIWLSGRLISSGLSLHDM